MINRQFAIRSGNNEREGLAPFTAYEIHGDELAAFVRVREDKARGRRVRIDDMMKAKTLDVVVELLIGTFGEHPVKSKGYLLWRKIFWIQSSCKEKNLSIRVIFNLKPERLNIFFLKIDTEYGSAFLWLGYCS